MSARPATVPRELWKPPSARRVRGLRERLRAIYGIPTMAPHGDPLAELILTVLSQSTNDRNRDVAFLRLRERLPSWAAVRDAPVEEIEQAIQPGGLHVQKSRRIKQILEALPEDLDLSWMSTAPVPEAREYLIGLPGVGRKTAACVLLFSYGRRDVPVDTHVSRVGTRLGLLRPGAALDPEQHEAMLALTPRGAELELHVNLLRHGRRTCLARARPASSAGCGGCVPYGRELTGRRGSRSSAGLSFAPLVERAVQCATGLSQVSVVAPAASFSCDAGPRTSRRRCGPPRCRRTGRRAPPSRRRPARPRRSRCRRSGRRPRR